MGIYRKADLEDTDIKDLRTDRSQSGHTITVFAFLLLNLLFFPSTSTIIHFRVKE